VQQKASHVTDVVKDQAPKAGDRLADAAKQAATMLTSKGGDEGAQEAPSAWVGR